MHLMLTIILNAIVLSFLWKQIQIDLVKEPSVNASNVNQHISWLLRHFLPTGRGTVAVIYNYAVPDCILELIPPSGRETKWPAVNSRGANFEEWTLLCNQ